jgi:AcrR family transcriptional regulator
MSLLSYQRVGYCAVIYRVVATGTQPSARRRMRAPERRAQLLSVARRVFGTAGFHAASMDAVAREAGVTKPILYDHFPSKRDLYLALLDADLASLHDRVKVALDAPIGNRERIRASFQAYFDFVDEHAEGFRLLMQETVGPERAFREPVRLVRERITTEVAHLIVRESKGLLDRGRAETVALALVGMVETVAQQDPGGPQAKRRAAVDTLVQLAWRGITNLTP